MKIVGQSIVVPLIDAALNHLESIELCPGVHIIRLTPEYRERLQKDEVLVGGYDSSLDRMLVGLSVEPSLAYSKKQLSLNNKVLMGIFVFFALRLSTEVSLDIPFWFDISEDGQILGIGQTLVRTYRSSPRYTYPLDEGLTYERIETLRPYISLLLERYLEQPDTDRVIKALEFAGIGFQTRHIPMRLVNQVVFMEVLFSSDVHELSFQLASRISWYLRNNKTPDEREEVFNTVRDIYKMRSKIVHGSSPKNPEDLRAQMRQMLDQSESVNSEIFREMLKRNHIELFSEKQRNENLRKLSLGLPCAFLKNINPVGLE